MLTGTASNQRGMTMVELLVAMAISTVLALAAISALVVSRQGFTTVDAASQLRDNARFVTDLVQRLGVQSGYKDVPYAGAARVTNVAGASTNPDPNIFGYNNMGIAAGSNPFNTATMPAGINGSDILVMRYQATETFPGSGVSDNAMIDCAGAPSSAPPTDRDDRLVSILHVANDNGEPSLMCTSMVPSSTGTYTTTAVVRGVETFQVLYGADGVTPLSPSTPLSATGTFGLMPKIFLRADQMEAGNAVDTNNNWRRVRALRIGLIMRADNGTAQSTIPSSGTIYYPLGAGQSSSTGTTGSALSAAAGVDPGTQLTPPSLPDTRLRQTVTFTVHLRNDQGY